MAAQQRSGRCPDGAASAVDRNERMEQTGWSGMKAELKDLMAEMKEDFKQTVVQLDSRLRRMEKEVQACKQQVEKLREEMGSGRLKTEEMFDELDDYVDDLTDAPCGRSTLLQVQASMR